MNIHLNIDTHQVKDAHMCIHINTHFHTLEAEIDITNIFANTYVDPLSHRSFTCLDITVISNAQA